MIKLEPLISLIPCKRLINKASVSYQWSRPLSLTPLRTDTLEINKNDLLFKPKNEIIKCITETIENQENFINAGGDANVYRIQGTPYCARIIKDFDEKVDETYKKKVSFDLKQEDKINFVIAKLGGRASIQKYLEGFPLAIWSNSCYKVSQEEVNNTVNKIPVASYNRLIKQIGEAFKFKMLFDESPANIMLNPKKMTLTAFDFCKGTQEDIKSYRVLKSLYNSMQMFNHRSCDNIAGKLILGALEELRPDINPCMNVSMFKFDDFVSCINQHIKLKDSYFNQLKGSLVEIENLKRLELSGVDVKRELEVKIKQLKAFVKKHLNVTDS